MPASTFAYREFSKLSSNKSARNFSLFLLSPFFIVFSIFSFLLHFFIFSQYFSFLFLIFFLYFHFIYFFYIFFFILFPIFFYFSVFCLFFHFSYNFANYSNSLTIPFTKFISFSSTFYLFSINFLIQKKIVALLFGCEMN